ncbi:DHA1 family tetracycline resistance protein-like MFS transporter [Actinoplanes lutulentus]|uniref:DHA1 family tetracycline resistance protein-like MFS transporter n=1 Tax=Actinoplanes lutulentus TaxID=1287878 RepID=A0A327Z0G4_9ACTN|nr:MFS transporter [Actinoplanes lutulentus]MBB2947664.1 DHA1 family tetracycline resistance protein-like MFS transporter [Actinoplanes lutulentus]RAK27720.1 DHA1 family tetracycline resistance protein-like MFS transporter [Actinoplanes lutulentus]
MHRAPALNFLLVTVFLDMLGLGIIVPIIPALMTTVTDDPATAVYWSGVLGSTYGVLQFAVSPLLGRLADRYGRRPVLLASLTLLGVDWLAHAAGPGPWTLLIFHALAGACAGTNTVVNAYVADVTPPAERASAYGRIGAAFGLGFVAGPILGGLLGGIDVRLPFLAAAALSFAGVAYGWFVLPESRPGDRVTSLSLRTSNPVGAIAVVLRRPVLGRLAYARMASDIARMTHQSVWTFFLAYQFLFSTTMVGVVMAVSALAGAVFQARAVGPIVRVLGDKRAAVIGTLISAAAFAGTAVASTPAQLYTLQAVGILGSIAGAASQSWLSGVVGPDEQGTVQGALTGIGAVAETVVPVTAGAVFAWSLSYATPGLIFLAAAAFTAASALLLSTTPAIREPA